MKKLMNKNALMAGAFALAAALALVFTLNQSPSVMAQTATPTATATATPAQVDYDEDDDRLIDISTFDQLNAMRYDTDGDGFVDIDYPEGDVAHTNYASAFLNSASNKGCPASSSPDDGSPTPPRCRGYELIADIVMPALKTGETSNWTPIPEWETEFTAEKNNQYRYTVSNMITNGNGMFAKVGGEGKLHHVALVNATVSFTPPSATIPTEKENWLRVGVLVAQNHGELRDVQAEGVITYTGFEANLPFVLVGGLVGRNKGTGKIELGYADVDVNIIGAGVRVGGFVGDNRGEINASFSSSDINVAIPATFTRKYIRAGGFVGVNNGSEGKGIIANSLAVGEVIPNSLREAFGPGNLKAQAFGPICARGGDWHTVVAPDPSGCEPQKR